MRVLICGGRDVGLPNTPDFANIHWVLYNRLSQKDVVIEGGARGVDAAAKEFAIKYKLKLETFRADWKAYGKGAGPIRNQQMLDEGKPDLVIAFPGGKGTANMVALARKAGIPVEEVNFEQ